MKYEILDVKTRKGVLLVTINRPKALNAINDGVMNDLDIFFTEGYKEYDQLKGVIITGAGEKAFVAGADIKGFLGLDAESAIHLSKKGQDIFFKIERFHLPVIAMVNGFSLGGGCELAMACHMRIVTPNAKFGQPEVNLGLLPGYGGTQRLPQIVGKSKAFEMILTGDMIDAKEAYRIGLANHICEDGEAMKKSKKIISKIASKGPTAIKKSIEAINAGYEKDKNGYENEYRSFGNMMVSDEAKEGINAFIEKRKANFRV